MIQMATPRLATRIDLTNDPLSSITPTRILEAAKDYRLIIMNRRQVEELRRRVYDEYGPTGLRMSTTVPDGVRAPAGAIGSIGSAWLIARQ